MMRTVPFNDLTKLGFFFLRQKSDSAVIFPPLPDQPSRIDVHLAVLHAKLVCETQQGAVAVQCRWLEFCSCRKPTLDLLRCYRIGRTRPELLLQLRHADYIIVIASLVHLRVFERILCQIME